MSWWDDLLAETLLTEVEQGHRVSVYLATEAFDSLDPGYAEYIFKVKFEVGEKVFREQVQAATVKSR